MSDQYDDYDNSDVFSASELYEMDRDARFRQDAEDDARNTAVHLAEQAACDDEPWTGLADGEER
jgi:hypothetical protein